MDDFLEPKSSIYLKLNTIEGVTVFQERPEILETFPCITFMVAANSISATLDKNIGRQNIQIKVDIFANTSIETGTILKEVIEKMLELNYVMATNFDVPDNDGLSHLSTIFTY